MLPHLFLITLAIISVCGEGQLTVLHHPSSLNFKGHDHVKESILKEIYSAALGFTTEQYSSWPGMYIEDPFDLAEAIAVVEVDGVRGTNLAKGHNFPLKTDVDEDIYETLRFRITERYPEGKSNLIKVSLDDGLSDIQNSPLFSGIKSTKPKKSGYNFLKISVDEDREFLQELNLLNAIATKIENSANLRDYIPDIFYFKVTSLHALSDFHGENSTVAKKAKQLLNEAILSINAAFIKAFKGSVLVSVITSDSSHTRRARNILADDTNPKTAPAVSDNISINVAIHYDENYPVFFNIILWFSVVMVFALLAICLVIGNMDPGRDSIIYRMTSTRMKKDN